MKKRFLVFLIPIIVLIIILGLFVFSGIGSRKFYLEDSYYGQAGFKEIDASELNQLIADQKSFALFIYQPACVTSAEFEEVLSSAIEEKSLTVYEIAFSKLAQTTIGDRIPYYPSFAIFKKGKLVDFLQSDQDEDTAKYQNKADFLDWLTSYVAIKTTSGSNQTDINSGSEEPETSHTTADLSHITKEPGKVNIYFFWGNGCPHCAEENKFFQEIESEYGKYYNLYRFETWYNDDNAELMKTFATAMGDKTKGVPYTVIGDQGFIGFPEEYKNQIKEAIKKSASTDYDIYFDKIKSELETTKKAS